MFCNFPAPLFPRTHQASRRLRSESHCRGVQKTFEELLSRLGGGQLTRRPELNLLPVLRTIPLTPTHLTLATHYLTLLSTLDPESLSATLNTSKSHPTLLVVTCLLLASKFAQDIVLESQGWASIVPVSKQALIAMEWGLLKALKWNLWPKDGESELKKAWEKWHVFFSTKIAPVTSPTVRPLNSPVADLRRARRGFARRRHSSARARSSHKGPLPIRRHLCDRSPGSQFWQSSASRAVKFAATQSATRRHSFSSHSLPRLREVLGLLEEYWTWRKEDEDGTIHIEPPLAGSSPSSLLHAPLVSERGYPAIADQPIKVDDLRGLWLDRK